MGYPGLPRETFSFLKGLEANNEKAWFEAHRADYDRFWLAAGLDLIAALSGEVAPMGLLAVPKLGASLRRIHRDVRFSRDKSPYQPWLHVILSTGTAFNKVPGVHLVLTPRGLSFGAGQYGFDPAALERVRRRMCDTEDRARLMAALDRAAEVGSFLDPPDLARVPKGFEAAEWDHLLRRKNLILRRQSDIEPPDWLFTPDAPENLALIVGAHLPVLTWMEG